MDKTVYEDAQQVIAGLGSLVNMFEGKKILITGYKGFLGSNFSAFFSILNDEYLMEKCNVTCIDNNIVDLEDQVSEYSKHFNIVKGSGIDDLDDNDFNYIIHCAGIASPTFYRRHPLETIHVNAIGYWDMLNKINTESLTSFLYFSTSEVYGDPDNTHIPTDEGYRGNVSSTGPRACYDESKRLGETISVSFCQQKALPVKIVRPFNVFGPFMRLKDKRVIPDFLNDALFRKEINILSDGSPTRAFCYVSDAVEGFLRALLIGEPGKPYNIGNDQEEIAMKDLASMVSELIPNTKVVLKQSSDKQYLADNPQRRCPVLKRACEDLSYRPKVSTKQGLERIINWYTNIYLS
jgi:UDP-glucuronate decarboxylase